MHRMMLCTLAAVGCELRLLKVLEVMRCMLEAVEGALCLWRRRR